MANIYPDQEIDPLWCNTGAPLAAGGEIPPLPCRNSTALSGGADPSPQSIEYSILVYVAVMLLVLLPLCPCFRCDEERDYRDTKRYINKRKADILEDVITKPAQEHTHKASDGTEATKEASIHETFEIGDLDNDAIDGEKVAACVGIDIGGPSSIETIDASSSGTEFMTEDGLSATSHSQHSTATSGGKLVCSICLEAFEAGEEVSWSRNTECNHCYHQECISQWLIKHDECPVCRNDYLFDDWKYNQLPPPEPPLLCILLRRPPQKCTCAPVEDTQMDKRTDCVFCVVHGLELPSGVALCETNSADDEESGGKLEDIDLEAGEYEGGLKCEAVKCNDPAPEIKTA